MVVSLWATHHLNPLRWLAAHPLPPTTWSTPPIFMVGSVTSGIKVVNGADETPSAGCIPSTNMAAELFVARRNRPNLITSRHRYGGMSLSLLIDSHGIETCVSVKREKPKRWPLLSLRQLPWPCSATTAKSTIRLNKLLLLLILKQSRHRILSFLIENKGLPVCLRMLTTSTSMRAVIVRRVQITPLLPLSSIWMKNLILGNT